MRVVLVVDHPLRDLPGLVLLAWRLCQRGVTCHLVPLNLPNEIWMLAPDFVLLNYLNVANEKFARRLLDAGINVGVLDTEGASRTEIAEKIVASDENTRFCVSFYCCWSAHRKEQARKQGWYLEDQLIVTGSPRFDFYVHPWREAALRAFDYAENSAGPNILIMGNFPLSNPLFKSPEEEVNWLVKGLGFDRGDVLNWQRTQGETMAALVELAKRLADVFPQANFLYRPHPFERLETYYPLFDGFENLHVVKKGPVYSWLLSARAMVQRSCFTAVEASMAGIPALLPAWIPSPASLLVAEDVSIKCGTQEQLFRTLECILAGDFRQSEQVQRRFEDIVESCFYKLDGQAHKRVASKILDSLPQNGADRRLRKCREMAYGFGKGTSFKRKARAAAVRMFGLPLEWSFRKFAAVPDDLSWWDTSEKHFDWHQVRRLVNAIQASALHALGKPCEVGVMQAQERGDYHFGYLNGRSVTVFPE